MRPLKTTATSSGLFLISNQLIQLCFTSNKTHYQHKEWSRTSYPPIGSLWPSYWQNI